MLSCKFSRVPRRIVLAGAERAFSEAAIEVIREEAYQRGRLEAVEQIERQREEQTQSLGRTLGALASQNEALIAQFCELLPGMVMDGVRRVLANVELDAEVVMKIVSELVAEVHPGTSGLEVILCESDLMLMEGRETLFQQKYPGICFVADRELQRGDCMVRSRFGNFDGRLATKIQNVEGLLQ